MALAGLAALAAIGTSVGATAYAAPQSQPVLSVSLTPAHAQAAAPVQGRAAGAPSWCAPGPNEYNRTQACAVENGTLTVRLNKKVVGRLNFTVTQHIGLNVKSSRFAEKFSVTFTSGAGDVTGFLTELTATCGGTCRAVSHVPAEPTRVGGTVSGTIDYSDSTTTKNTTRTSYALAFTRPGYQSTPARWSSLNYRCDKGNKAGRTGNYGTGCVFPGFRPFETQQAALPGISKNIARIQKAGPHHYGAYGLHGAALHRTANGKTIADNRRVACGKRKAPTRGVSCDEYPFASTREGAANKSAKRGDWGWAWVPVSEQNKQRDILNNFYRNNRILDGDAFWVAV
ncbi:hypothetical protein AQI95_42675 [Streptomyces yokosukanensis]|uniref:Deoxyribonuclease NucA/NucB domain-containing protein n=1 Tax=Streptomyces yokosukanensis TaxID=67386 RepID=A0A101NNF7_9ACTN|nr:hypothetical protein AQI95_42675 [Streptomyces yokosukanensis]